MDIIFAIHRLSLLSTRTLFLFVKKNVVNSVYWTAGEQGKLLKRRKNWVVKVCFLLNLNSFCDSMIAHMTNCQFFTNKYFVSTSPCSSSNEYVIILCMSLYSVASIDNLYNVMIVDICVWFKHKGSDETWCHLLFLSFRNKRMFGLLLGTLHKFKQEATHFEDKVRKLQVITRI